MRKFKFKFEAVEKIRKQKERDALLAFANAQRGLREAENTKKQLILRLESALSRREVLGDSPVSNREFIVEEDFIQGTKQRILQAHQGILRAQRNVEKALEFYMHARQQRMMMDRLREKDFAKYREDRTAKETRELDDLTIMRARLREERA